MRFQMHLNVPLKVFPMLGAALWCGYLSMARCCDKDEKLRDSSGACCVRFERLALQLERQSIQPAHT